LQQLGSGEGAEGAGAGGAAGEKTGGPAGGIAGLNAREEGLLYFDQARDAIAEVTALLRDTAPSYHASLRKIGKILVESFRHNPRLMAMMGALMTEQGAQAMPAAATAPAPSEPPAVTRANGVLVMPDDERIAALAQEGGALLDELS